MTIGALRGVHRDGDAGIDSVVSGDCGDNRLTTHVADLKEMNHYKGAHFVIECTFGGTIDIVHLVAGDGTDPRCRQTFELHYIPAEDDVYGVYASHFERRASVGEILQTAILDIAAADC